MEPLATAQSSSNFSTAVESLQDGGIVILNDDAARTPLSYLFCAAHLITPEAVNTMAIIGRSVICAPTPNSALQELGVPLMGKGNGRHSFDMAVGVEARHGVTTGISAADRAQTLRVLATTKTPRRDLVMPGHIFPLRARDGGVLVRHSVVEAITDTLQHSKLPPVGAMALCLDESGEAIGPDAANQLATEHGWKTLSVSEVVAHRMQLEKIIEEIATSKLPTAQAGTFLATVFRSRIDDAEHLALVKGDISKRAAAGEPILVRVQAEQGLSDLLGVQPQQSRRHLVGALKRIDEEGCGLFVYIRHPRKGFLERQVRDLKHGNAVAASRSARSREIGIGAQILSHFGLSNIRLLSNSKSTPSGLDAFGLTVVEQVPYTLGERQCLSAWAGTDSNSTEQTNDQTTS